MIQTTQYRQLQPEDRMTMASMKQQGLSARAMARTLSRSPSTITRELARNTLTAMPYGSHTAQVASLGRRIAARPAAKLAFDGVGWGVVRTMLDCKWSPQQIAASLKRVFPDDPDDPAHHVSHETIYTSIYAQPRGERRKQLVACFRHGRGTRLPRTQGEDRRGQIPDRVSIHVRPPEVEDRVMPGRWEGDFIKGTGNKSSVGVLVERTSRPVLLAKMDDAAAASALAGFSAELNSCRRPSAQELHPRPRQGDVSARRSGRADRREGLLLRSAQPLAARHLREHQRAHPTVLAPEHRPQRIQLGQAQ